MFDASAGTVVRSFPASDSSPGDHAEHWLRVSGDDKGPWVYVYELPGIAQLTSVSTTAPVKTGQGQGSTAAFAVSTSGPNSGFRDIGTISSNTTDAAQTVSLPNVPARWIRVTISSNTGSGEPIGPLVAQGTLQPLPASAKIAGVYVEYDHPYSAKNGAFATAPDDKDPWYIRVATAGTGAAAEQCFDGHLGDSYAGTLDRGRSWQWQNGDQRGTLVANDDATMIVGVAGSSPVYFVRSSNRPKFCEPQVTGSGPVNVLVLDSRDWVAVWPFRDADSAKDAPRYRFTRIGASMVDAQQLASASAVILNGLCNADDVFSPGQGQLIAQWVQAGHKALIYDADVCSKQTHYGMLPYQFQTNNPGAKGAKGDRLIQVEDDTLGTADKSDKAHFFDPSTYAQLEYNQLGDANTVTTHDDHWCGHLFGTNANHVNGFMQMYSLYGKGLFIYDGFDRDDANLDPYRRIRMLELDQSVPADLPCSQKASLGFIIEPDRSSKFAPGRAATQTFSMELLANQGWRGHVNVTTSGDFKASVTPSSFDTNGGTQPLRIAVSIPANAKATTYSVIVSGTGNGAAAQSTIQFVPSASLAKQFAQRRIRIYGIHFDVDKATIKPQSEPVIAQIAAVMKQNPSWRFRVEGHTDSDGGYQHNMVLSQQRAQAVVNDLVNRYHIARSRLVAVGYGYTHPVAPNSTDAGKALNRRVELVRL